MADDDAQIIRPANRQEWLAERRRDVTASKMGVMVDCDPRTSRYRYWAEKTGRVVPDDDLGNKGLERGRKLEKLGVEEAAAHLPPDSKIEHNTENMYWRLKAKRIGATPDVLVYNARGKGIVQIKSLEPSIFAREWIDGEPPLYVALQALAEAKIVGATWAMVGALRVGFGYDFDLIEIPLHDGAWTALQRQVDQFWRDVDSDQIPTPNYRKDGDVIAAVHRYGNGNSVDLSHDNELVSALAERELHKSRNKAIEAELTRLDAMIRHKAGDNETVIAGDYRVSLRPHEVKAYTVPARTQRPIRITRTREALP